jgi:hypothetical protein
MEPSLIPSIALWIWAFSVALQGGVLMPAVTEPSVYLQIVVDGDIHVLHLQTTTKSAVKLPSGFGPPTSVTLYPIFK